MTRSEHMAWAKSRALEYLPGDPNEAFMSMMSDLTKHPETSGHAAIELGMMLKFSGHLETEQQVRKFIEGFN